MHPDTDSSRTRLLIADDHESVRRGLRFVLSGAPDFEVIGEADSVPATLRAIDALAPDIVVLDFMLGDENSSVVLDALSLKQDAPGVLMFSMEDERVVGREMTRRGAAAYLTKDASTSEILAQLRKIRNTRRTRQEPRAEHASPPAADAIALTRREREVLLLLRKGLPGKSIARRLSISAYTVDVHKHRLRQKLGLRTDLELARYAALFAEDQPIETRSADVVQMPVGRRAPRR
jgi:DNA-binding NarL/FixJ family response regulator